MCAACLELYRVEAGLLVAPIVDPCPEDLRAFRDSVLTGWTCGHVSLEDIERARHGKWGARDAYEAKPTPQAGHRLAAWSSALDRLKAAYGTPAGRTAT